MATDWTRLAAALDAHGQAYLDMLAARAETRENSKKRRKAEEAYLEAHNERVAAALEVWDPELDGETTEGKPSVGSVIQRYYAETTTPQGTKTRRGK